MPSLLLVPLRACQVHRFPTRGPRASRVLPHCCYLVWGGYCLSSCVREGTPLRSAARGAHEPVLRSHGAFQSHPAVSRKQQKKNPFAQGRCRAESPDQGPPVCWHLPLNIRGAGAAPVPQVTSAWVRRWGGGVQSAGSCFLQFQWAAHRAPTGLAPRREMRQWRPGTTRHMPGHAGQPGGKEAGRIRCSTETEKLGALCI